MINKKKTICDSLMEAGQGDIKISRIANKKWEETSSINKKKHGRIDIQSKQCYKMRKRKACDIMGCSKF